MSTDIALSPRISAVLASLGKHAAARPAKAYGSFLKFNGKTGVYTYGKEKAILPIGTEVRFDFTSMQHGWSAWPSDDMEERGVESKPLFQEFVPISEDVQPVDMLPSMPTGVEYHYAMSVALLTPRAEKLVFQNNTDGGVETMVRVRDEIINHAESGMAGVEGAFPIVQMNERHYQHKLAKRGTIYVPKLDIIGWTFAV